MSARLGGRIWVWASLVILAATPVAMVVFARPYYVAREAKSDDALGGALARMRPREAAGLGGVALVLLLALMVAKPF